MIENAPASVLIVAGDDELPESERIWGTGGWQPPEAREALDWFTLARFLGWPVRLTWASQLGDVAGHSQAWGCIVIGCEPTAIRDEAVRWLESVLDRRQLLVVTRIADPPAPLTRLTGPIRQSGCAVGREIEWCGPGDQGAWHTRTGLELPGLRLDSGNFVWATLDGTPVIAARRVGQGVVAAMGFHPSAARDTAGAATALLRHLLTRGTPGPAAWLDLEGSLVLRMDDPGGAQNVHCKAWHYPKLGQQQWNTIAADLKRRDARLSIVRRRVVCVFFGTGIVVRASRANRVPSEHAARVESASPLMEALLP